LEDVVLSGANSSLLDEMLIEHHRVEVLKSHGLRPPDRLLFCGPPGCGKTASNLRQVFDFAASFPTVTLFDEFDAIAKERADDADHG